MNEVEVELLFYAFENVSREEIQVHYVSSSVRREIDFNHLCFGREKCTYRISSNKRPGRLFQIWVLRVLRVSREGAYSRGALIRGRALIRGNTVRTYMQTDRQINRQTLLGIAGFVGFILRSGSPEKNLSSNEIPQLWGSLSLVLFIRRALIWSLSYTHHVTLITLMKRLWGHCQKNKK